MSNRKVPRWHKVTQGDFDQYVGVSGDRNPLHTDPNFARTLLGQKLCTNPIIHGTMIMMILSRDVWTEYGDGATAGGCKEQRFRVPVEVGDEIGFNYEETDRQATKIGADKWDGFLVTVRVTAYKKIGERELRIGGLLTEVVVPTAETLAVVKERLKVKTTAPVLVTQPQATA
ncbi:MAG: MaoC family dehydratase [Candidatus Berkelbacteria bacterium]|nr:MAG: MaoC family dehydratase [Candidatus Berkelbacteria bacterium]QQG51861.1 MAG: MaoC family dehydratase [Candidatus Berkelbacteria bacterium]